MAKSLDVVHMFFHELLYFLGFYIIFRTCLIGLHCHHKCKFCKKTNKKQSSCNKVFRCCVLWAFLYRRWIAFCEYSGGLLIRRISHYEICSHCSINNNTVCDISIGSASFRSQETSTTTTTSHLHPTTYTSPESL